MVQSKELSLMGASGWESYDTFAFSLRLFSRLRVRVQLRLIQVERRPRLLPLFHLLEKVVVGHPQILQQDPIRPLRLPRSRPVQAEPGFHSLIPRETSSPCHAWPWLCRTVLFHLRFHLSNHFHPLPNQVLASLYILLEALEDLHPRPSGCVQLNAMGPSIRPSCIPQNQTIPPIQHRLITTRPPIPNKSSKDPAHLLMMAFE
mmetsp:Transcript_11205/g.20307  ORF Transcript_11205/g.20307 Transcript_11205/m.20307 type:complete len:203 (-) Transcript_11205:1221-1829(-)